jgi:hypothetical protein
MSKMKTFKEQAAEALEALPEHYAAADARVYF